MAIHGSPPFPHWNIRQPHGFNMPLGRESHLSHRQIDLAYPPLKLFIVFNLQKMLIVCSAAIGYRLTDESLLRLPLWSRHAIQHHAQWDQISSFGGRPGTA